jgi:hypothetical protein
MRSWFNNHIDPPIASLFLQRNCCVDPILAPCFFVVFVLISQFVLVNVVVAVLMKHLEESNKREAATEGGKGREGGRT